MSKNLDMFLPVEVSLTLLDIPGNDSVLLFSPEETSPNVTYGSVDTPTHICKKANNQTKKQDLINHFIRLKLYNTFLNSETQKKKIHSLHVLFILCTVLTTVLFLFMQGANNFEIKCKHDKFILSYYLS